MSHSKPLTLAVWALGWWMAAAPGFGDADPLQIGFVYVSAVGDAGWSYRHDQARRELVQEFGERIRTTAVESVQEGPDAERVIRRLAASGHRLVFTTSFGFMNPTLRVARAFPNHYFEHASGYKVASNVGNYQIRAYQGRYLNGLLAGAMTRSGRIGYVAAYPIPEVIRGINAYALGALSVNPQAIVQVLWTSSWNDPPREREATDALVRQGADVISHHTDSVAVAQAAEAAGVWCNPFNSDMSRYAPTTQLSATVLNWLPFYRKHVDDVLDATWQSEALWWGLAEGAVELAPLHAAIPEGVRQLLERETAALRRGEAHVFQGPLHRQDGALRLAMGERLSDEELLAMDWFVAGVQASAP